MTVESAGPADREERLSAILAACLEAMDNGAAVDPQLLLARHPEYADELSRFFEDQDCVGRCVAPLRAATRAHAPLWGAFLRGGFDGSGRLGDFRLSREVGRGGMGVVYDAEQLSLGRRVALKVLPLGATMDPRQLQRFHNEARAAASLHHEHIVPVYAVGEERGVHYYAMQFIDGHTLAQLIAAQRGPAGPATADVSTVPHHPAASAQPAADTAVTAGVVSTVPPAPGRARYRAVAELGVQAADALEHAHALGIVHRDVKPANLMLDGQGKLWVTDFGLARFGVDAGLTATGDLVGTLRYMSPEQALAKHGLVDHRTDVYALGATLYELLTLRPAVGGKDREEVLRAIAFEEPRPPRHWDRALPVDLEIIVQKAMAKDAADRYATARDLADDLRRFLHDQPIRARRPALPQRVWRWGRRHRAAVTAAAGALVVALLALGVATALTAAAYRSEAQQRQLAESARLDEAAQRHEAEDQRDRTRHQLYVSRMRLAQRAWQESNVGLVLGLLDACRPEPGLSDLRGWEWYHLRGLCAGELADLETDYGLLADLAWSPDGRRLAATGVFERRIQVWDLTTGRKQVILPGPGRGPARTLTWCPDGRRLAWADSGQAVRVWDLAEDREVLTVAGPFWSVAWAPDGRQFAALTWPRARGGPYRMTFWDAATGRPLREFPLERDYGRIDWSPDGRHLAARTNATPAAVHVWDVATGRRTLALMPSTAPFDQFAWSPRGDRLALGYSEGVWVFEAATGKELIRLPGAGGPDWSPDGRRLAAPSRLLRHAVEVWDADTGRSLLTVRGHTGPVRLVRWSPDGTRLASGTNEVIKVWDAAARPGRVQLGGGPAPARGVSWSPDGRRLVNREDGHTLRTWDWAAHRELAVITVRETFARRCAWSPDGELVADHLPEEADAVGVWDAATGRLVRRLRATLKPPAQPIPTGPVAWSSNGRLLAALVADHSVRVWDVAAGEEVATLAGDDGSPCEALTWSPDGRRLALGFFSGVLLVYPAGAWRDPVALPVGRGRRALAWSPDGRHLASADGDRVAVWDPTARRVVLEVHSPAGSVVDLAWSPAADRLAGAAEGSVTVWETTHGDEVLTLEDAGRAVAWSPDGQWLATAGPHDAALRVWSAPAAGSAGPAAAGPPVSELLRRADDRYAFGYALVQMGRHEEAQQCFREAVALRQQVVARLPTEPEYRLLVARAECALTDSLRQVGRLDAAEEACREGLRTTVGLESLPDRADVGLLHWHLGSLLLRKEQYGEATAEYEKAISCYAEGHEASHSTVSDELASVLLTCPREEFRNPERAIALARDAATLQPRRQRYWHTLGLAHYRAGHWKEAADAIEQSNQVADPVAQNDFVLAMARWQLGDKDEARKCYDRGVRWVEQNKPQSEAVRRFRAEAEQLLTTP